MSLVFPDYSYDVDNRLVTVEDGAGGAIGVYGYDPFGRRLWKEVDGVRTYFLYSDEGLVGEYDGAGNAVKTYGWWPGSTWGTDPLFMAEGGQYYWYLNDHLGTPQKLINNSGQVVWSAVYDAFGKAEVGADSVVENNLRFPGQYWDGETGLHYNWHRYYDPGTGRYLRTDPIGFAGGINLYGYVGGNVVNRLDPRGLDWSVELFLKWLNRLTNVKDAKNMAESIDSAGTHIEKLRKMKEIEDQMMIGLEDMSAKELEDLQDQYNQLQDEIPSSQKKCLKELSETPHTSLNP